MNSNLLSSTYKPSKNVTSVRFLDSLRAMPALETRDVSEAHDGSVRSWIESSVEYVASNGKVVAPASCKGMFKGCRSLHALDLSNFDTSNVTNMSEMFDDCYHLRALDLSNFDTSNVTNMSGMFKDCSSLKALDLSDFDTSNVTDMSRMFKGCSFLNALDYLNCFDISKVTNEFGMFYDGIFLLPMLKKIHKSQSKFKMVVEDIFQITGRGLAITGIVEGADLQTGAEVEWLHQSVKKTATVAGIEHKRRVMQKATAGMKVGLLLHNATKQDISKGDIITIQDKQVNTGGNTVFPIHYDFKDNKTEDLAQINKLLATMKLTDLDLDNSNGYLETVTDKKGDVTDMRYGLSSGTLNCTVARSNQEGHTYQIGTFVAVNANDVDNEKILDRWRKAHPDQVIRTAIIYKFGTNKAIVITYHEKP